ncbi:MAG: hypothetical protein Q9187_004990 [Circinaria calcarea]
MEAYNLCGAVGSSLKVDITQPYRPEELSTLGYNPCSEDDDGNLRCPHKYTMFNFADLKSCSFPYPGAGDSRRCLPFIAFSSIGFNPETLHHEWANCKYEPFDWIQDPPYALTSVGALDALSITLPTLSQTRSATAGAVPPAFPTETAPPEDPPILTRTRVSAMVGNLPTESLSSAHDPSSQGADSLVSKIEDPSIHSKAAESHADLPPTSGLQTAYTEDAPRHDGVTRGGQIVAPSGSSISSTQNPAATRFNSSLSIPLSSSTLPLETFTLHLPKIPTASPASSGNPDITFTIGTEVLTYATDAIIIGQATVTRNAPALTSKGYVVSLGSSDVVVVIGGSGITPFATSKGASANTSSSAGGEARLSSEPTTTTPARTNDLAWFIMSGLEGMDHGPVSPSHLTSTTLGITSNISASGNSSFPIVPFPGAADGRRVVHAGVRLVALGSWIWWSGGGV